MNSKQFLSIVAIALLLTLTVWVLITWLIAYFVYDSIILISINQYGEAIPEIIYLVVLVGIGIFTLFYIIKCFRNHREF